MNLLQYTDKSGTIDNKLSSLLAQINYDYQNGNIRTETEYYYRIKNMLNEFYKSLVRPTFKFRPAVSTPISDEYNAMITESYNDMEYIIKDCKALEEIVRQSFVDAELSRNMMVNELAYMAQQINTIGASIATNQGTGVVTFTELFNDVTKTGNMRDENGCHVNTTYGICTLRNLTVSRVNIKDITIDPEVSNGLPGNTHVVDTMNKEMHFVGQEGLHMDPKNMIDSHSDTWFEFELFSITDEVRKQCNSYGFEFDEGVTWINNEDPLKLKIVVEFDTASTCSWIALTPHLSEVKGVRYCILEECNIVTASNNTFRVAQSAAFDDTMIFPFPPQQVQRVEMVFTQPSKYAVKVGHFYYTAAETSDMSIFSDYDYTDMFARVDGPKPSVALLGCKYDPTTQWVTYNHNKDKTMSDSYIKDKLFTCPPSTIEKKSNQEMIDAYRYVIGISSISCLSGTFVSHGEHISTVFTTEEVITSIMLECNEYIPGDDPEILQYFISLNGGVTWHKIYPIHRAYAGIYKYYVNNDSIENLICNDLTQKKAKNLSVVGEPKQIQLKITMKRPEGEHSEYGTPIVYDYRLKVTTGGDTIEY